MNILDHYENGTRSLSRRVARVLSVSHYGKCLKEAKVVGKINNEKATMMNDFGEEVSIINNIFARKVVV